MGSSPGPGAVGAGVPDLGPVPVPGSMSRPARLAAVRRCAALELHVRRLAGVPEAERSPTSLRHLPARSGPAWPAGRWSGGH
jgi:hypothetical protein